MSKENKRRFYIVLMAAILLLISSGYLYFKYQDAQEKLRERGTYIDQLEEVNQALKDSVDKNARIIAQRGTQIDKKKKRIQTLGEQLKSSHTRIEQLKKESAEKIDSIDNSTLNEREEMLAGYSEKLNPIKLRYDRDTVFAFKENGQKEILRLFEQGEQAKREVNAMLAQDTIQRQIINTQDSVITAQDITINDYQRSVMLYEQIVDNYDEQKDEYEHVIDLKEDKINGLKWQNRALWGGVVIGAAVIVKMLISD